jgi:hypothetical protein
MIASFMPTLASQVITIFARELVTSLCREIEF